MLQNYFTIAIQSIVSNKFTTCIDATSLAITMKSILIIDLFLEVVACYSQQVKQPNDRIIADNCDGCELMYEGIPLFKDISSETILPNKEEPGEPLEISGMVFE